MAYSRVKSGKAFPEDEDNANADADCYLEPAAEEFGDDHLRTVSGATFRKGCRRAILRYYLSSMQREPQQHMHQQMQLWLPYRQGGRLPDRGPHHH